MDTIAAPITPLIVSSIIVVRISGGDVSPFFDLVFKSDFSKFTEIGERKVYNGVYVCNSIRDDVLFTYFKAPMSYTGEDVIEVSFHGNPLIVRSFLIELTKYNIRNAMPGEFTKRAFINGKIDLSQAEAVNELINAKSEQGIFYAFSQLKGAVKNLVYDIKNILIDIITVVETIVEYPEDELEGSDLKNALAYFPPLLEKVSDIIQSYSNGVRSKNGFSVSIAGKPNVGKSSLLNFLLSYDRAIVSDIPGTTRDYIEEVIDVHGVPVRILDTAGIRHSHDKIEMAGIEHSITLIKDSDIVIVVLDMSNELTDEDLNVLDLVKEKKYIVLGNKCDLQRNNNYPADIEISLKNSINVNQVIDRIADEVKPLDSDKINKFQLISDRHHILFSTFYDNAQNLMYNIDNLNLDIIIFELYVLLDIITEITGDKYVDEILDNIFNKFCIGK